MRGDGVLEIGTQWVKNETGVFTSLSTLRTNVLSRWLIQQYRCHPERSLPCFCTKWPSGLAI